MLPYQMRTFDGYLDAYRRSMEDPDAFWADVAGHFNWHRKWDFVSRSDFDNAQFSWFGGAMLNITENCLDRHLEDKGNDIALCWEPNDPAKAVRKLSYRELHREVCRAAEMLRWQGICKGDRVCIYMGMVPELVIAMLACARIGAIHSVIFGGFSAQSIADRVEDAGARHLICCDGAFRGAKEIALKDIVDDALVRCPAVANVIVFRHTGCPVRMLEGRDHWWHEVMLNVDDQEALQHPAESVDSEDPLFILYTSGSTGKPKGVVHTCGGYMVYTAYSFANVFQYQPGQIHFCTADIGWVTGHSYIVYGPLCIGATSLMFEGVPTWPDAGRFWHVVDRHRVDILYTAPTAIRSLMSFGEGPLEGKDLSSLKVIGSVGEPINEEAWQWYHDQVGKGRCPVVDTWWQTETGGILISTLAGVTPQKPSFATLPLPGIFPVLLNERGQEVTALHENGYLCMAASWPGIIRTTYGNHERCRAAYFNQFPGYYFTGDGAYRDENGYYRITGRIDDVLNVSGHRLGTAEIENAINEHPEIVESAVVGFPHDIKGQGIYAYVVHTPDIAQPDALRNEINETIARFIGPFARADKIQFVSGLPKTRSGKIMRRILRKIAEGETQQMGDVTTLLDPGVVEEIALNRL
ncbi:MAG: Acetyl-coenzyme A synthetase [Saprospiraceae bacterium]|jgi:acetyl-CoA synthetase|nr:Acetyl-coenzyme A synthetase [Saprospiraceae bacterium]